VLANHSLGNTLPFVICLMGPTASGKTDLAVNLCNRLPCDIISVDSALVYRGMNIGTAKPDAELLTKTPHRLVDIRDPLEPYSAADFVADAQKHIALISKAGRIPLLVGGTMLYFKVLLEGMAKMPIADPEVRAQIAAEAHDHGWPHIHQRLTEVDPAMAAEIHPNHSQRLARALEVYVISGVTMSEWRVRQKEEEIGRLHNQYNIVQLAICPTERTELHRRIVLRFDKMVEQGFLEEVESLYARGDLHKDLPSIRAVGYRQAWLHLQGEYDFETFREKSIIATRQLAKRQLTWLRGWDQLQWIYTSPEGGAYTESLAAEPKYSNSADLALKYIGTVGI
jgi:tRNA dimethylallyltransferase